MLEDKNRKEQAIEIEKIAGSMKTGDGKRRMGFRIKLWLMFERPL